MALKWNEDELGNINCGFRKMWTNGYILSEYGKAVLQWKIVNPPKGLIKDLNSTTSGKKD